MNSLAVISVACGAAPLPWEAAKAGAPAASARAKEMARNDLRMTTPVDRAVLPFLGCAAIVRLASYERNAHKQGSHGAHSRRQPGSTHVKGVPVIVRIG